MTTQALEKQPLEKQFYTPEEYLNQEIQSQERHEYRNGEILPMVGGTPNHNLIIGNLYAALRAALKHQPYFVFFSDQRLAIPEKKIYTYPDIMVISGEIQLLEGRKDTITNPSLMIEVLSESTKAYDRDEKFQAYRTIPTFQEYVLVDQYSLRVEQYIKTEPRKWIFSEYDGVEMALILNTVPVEIPLVDIYEKVNFDAESAS